MKLEDSLNSIKSSFENYDKECESAKLLNTKRDHTLALIERHSQSLAKIKKQIDAEHLRTYSLNPYIESAYLKPIADAVLTKFPGMTAEISGPYGIGCMSYISIHDPAKTGEQRDVAFLKFTIDLKTKVVSYVDLSTKLDNYPEGSMGDVNGLNYATVEIGPEMELDELVSKFVPCNETASANT